MLQFKVSPIYEDDSSDLEHDGNEEEADEGNQEEGSLPVNAKTGKQREDNLCKAEAEAESPTAHLHVVCGGCEGELAMMTTDDDKKADTQ